MAEICPLCGNKSLINRNGEMHFDPPKHISTETVIVKDARWEQCEECGEKIFSGDLEREIDRILRERSSSQGKPFAGLTWEEEES
jgi:YgiT-type zinc finger domain-containing protein